MDKHSVTAKLKLFTNFAPSMKIQVKTQIEILQGDITHLKVDAIVNAANTTLLGGGGVDGAIHRAAGPELLEECRKLHGCKTGDAKITDGHNLPAKHVIHTVGPVWNGGKYHEPELLASCYRRSLEIAADNNIRTIAFPAISTGVYRYPPEEATKIALTETKKFLGDNHSILKIIFVCFDSTTLAVYKKLTVETFPGSGV